jgi:hypothetical protein
LCLHLKFKLYGIQTFGVGLHPRGAALGNSTSPQNIAQILEYKELRNFVTVFDCRKKEGKDVFFTSQGKIKLHQEIEDQRARPK